MAGFAQDMRRRRALSGLSLRQLARAAHIDPGHLSRIESGQRQPTAEVATAVDVALHAGGQLAALAHSDPLADAARESEQLTRLLCNAPDADAFGETAEALAVDYLAQPATVMLERTATARRKAITRLRRSRRPSADLTRAIGQMSGVLAYAAVDLNHPQAALAHCEAAWSAADAAGDHELQAWVRGTQSLISRFDGRFVRALRFAEDGLRFAGADGTGRARLLCGVAQCAANLGDRGETHKALHLASDARDVVDHDAPGLFGFSLAKQHYYSASSLIWLPEPADLQLAISEAEQAIDLWETGNPADRSLDDEALARVYAATAAVQLGDVEQAAVWLEPILSLPEDRRISWIIKRMGRVADLLRERRVAGPTAGELRERIGEYGLVGSVR